MSLLALDQNLTESLYSLTRDNIGLQRVVYDVATYLIFLLPLLLVTLVIKPNTRFVAAKIFGATVITWQVFNKLVGEFFYTQYGFRDRPFAFGGLRELLFEQPQKSFPSDHAAVLLFVTLSLFYYRQKTWAWVFLVITVLSSLARVTVGFHWVGDIFGGWLIGAIGFGLLVIIDRPLQAFLEKIWSFITRKSYKLPDEPETS
ncbi:MAG: phosphatase PAP2 family protein [Candidatus Berkelbacteria bacterium]|nr:phosphatase PAP2 family protein [Candidatus Berkelbacteria bacterium]MCR4308219.1 phosphatase PAP2 family protein [Candidatus Berkelbacteria bacterium]